MALRGTFTVASAKQMTTTIGLDIREHAVVILDFSDTVYLDQSASLVIGRLIDTALAENTECIVKGLDGIPKTNLESMNVLRRVPEDHFADSLDEARELARQLISQKR